MKDGLSGVYQKSDNFAKFGNCSTGNRAAPIRAKRLTHVDNYGKDKEWPWHLAIWDKVHYFICSGVLLNNEWALTGLENTK